MTDIIRTEYGVRLAWPDGTVEVLDRSGRAAAECQVRVHNGATDGRTSRAEVVHRVVTATAWESVVTVDLAANQDEHGSEPGS